MSTFQPPAAVEAPKVEEKPGIPIGLGTILGVLGTGIASIVTLITAILNGDHTAETITSLISAVLLLAITIAGRFLQAYAVYRDSPSPQTVTAILDELTAPPPDPVTHEMDYESQIGPGKPVARKRAPKKPPRIP